MGKCGTNIGKFDIKTVFYTKQLIHIGFAQLELYYNCSAPFEEMWTASKDFKTSSTDIVISWW